MICLVIRITVLGFLVSAIFLKNRNRYRQHEIVMLSAAALYTVAILYMIVPSFTAFFSMPNSIDYTDGLMIAALIHVSWGIAAALLGIRDSGFVAFADKSESLL